MTTILAILSGLALLFLAILQEGGIKTFIDPAAMLITFGGTFAALFISYPLSRIVRALRETYHMLRASKEPPSWVVVLIINLAYKARQKSLISLEEDISKIDNSLIKHGLEMIVDGHPPELVRDILETELDFMETRHHQGEMFFRSGAKFAPAFGLIGTLIGLITMLRQLGPGGLESLGSGMAVALITTFYGAMAANLIFTPVADKLRSISNSELLKNRLILDGVLLIQTGMNPRIIEKKLNAYLPQELRVAQYERLIEKSRNTRRR